MTHNDFILSITAELVDVSHKPSVSHPRAKIFGVIFTFVTTLIFAGFALFVTGNDRGLSLWQE